MKLIVIFLVLCLAVTGVYALDVPITITKDDFTIRLNDSRNFHAFGVNNFSETRLWNVQETCAVNSSESLQNISQSIATLCGNTTEQIRSVVQQRLDTFQGDQQSYLDSLLAPVAGCVTNLTTCQTERADYAIQLEGRKFNESEFVHQKEKAEAALAEAISDKNDLFVAFWLAMGTIFILVLLLIGVHKTIAARFAGRH